jgi:hypothetical protein
MAKILLIGPLTQDLIKIKDRVKYSLGGSVYYAAETFNGLGNNVVLAPLIAKSNKSILKDINKKIIVKPLEMEIKFLFENIYDPEKGFQRKQKLRKKNKLGASLTIKDIENLNLIDFDLIFIGPQSKKDISLEVLKYIYEKNSNICLHAQAFFREFYEDEVKEIAWKEAHNYLSYVKTVILSEKQLLALSRKNINIKRMEEPNQKIINKAIALVNIMGPKEIIVNQNEKGFIVFTKEKIFSSNYLSEEEFFNPNGVTGTFSAVYLSERLNCQEIKTSINHAINGANVKLNSWKPLKHNIKKIKEIVNVRNFIENC